MSRRYGLLGLAGAFVAAGTAGAAPNDPAVAGRASDPAAQELYQPEIILAGYRSVPMPPRSIPATVGRSAAGAAIAVPTSGMGHVVGASLATGIPSGTHSGAFGDVTGAVQKSITHDTIVPLGTVPIDD